MSVPSARFIVPAVVGVTGGSLFVIVAAQATPLVAAAAVVAAIVGAAVVAFPYAGFLLTASVVPLERIGRLTDDASTYNFSLMRVVGMATLGALLLHVFLQRRKILVTTPVLLYAAFAAIGLLTLGHTTDFSSGVRAASAVLGNLLFFFLAVNVITTPSRGRAAIVCWLMTTTVIAVFTVYQWHNPAAIINEDAFNATGERTQEERFSTVLSDASEYASLDRTPRALGSTSHPAVYGINLILAVPFFAYLFRTVRGRWWQAAIVVAAIATCYNVMLANTRAAVITLAVCLLLIVTTGLIRLSWRVVAAGAVVSLLALPLLPGALYDRIFDVSNYTVARSETLRARLIYWEEGLVILRENWLFGIGLGNQSELPRRLSKRMHMPPNSTVHNEYLQSLLETGLVGYPFLVAFIVTLYRRCRQGERGMRQDGDEASALMMTAARVALLSMLFYATQVDVLHFPLKGWWLAMGIAVALSERHAWYAARRAPAAA